jgi:hypothetical protein
MAKTKTKTRALGTPTTEALLADGEKAAIYALRTVIHTVGLDVTACSLVMVHQSATEFLGKHFELQALPNGPWSFAVAPTPKTLAFAANDVMAVPPDRALVVVAAREQAMMHMVSVEELLPPSPPPKTTTGPDGQPLVTLKYLGLMFYRGQFEQQAQRDWQAKFAAKVRGAVLAELAKPGPKRPLVEITYDVLGGPRMERRLDNGEHFSKVMQEMLESVEQAPS